MVGSPGLFLLSQACIAVKYALGVPYLVGSAITTKEYRDVDVRVIVDDTEYERLFPGLTGNPRVHPLWSLLCSAVSLHLAQASGLPVDFQIQSTSIAEAKFGGCRRIALGVFVEHQAEGKVDDRG